MTDARDRAIVALCDTIADLRKRVAQLEMMAVGARPRSPEPYGKSADERYQEWIDKGSRRLRGRVVDMGHSALTKFAIPVCILIAALAFEVSILGRNAYWQGYNDGMACAAQIRDNETTTRCAQP